jgi:hypothetical protein
METHRGVRREVPTVFRQSAHRWRCGCQPWAPVALYPQKHSWYSGRVFLISMFNIRMRYSLKIQEVKAYESSRFLPMVSQSLLINKMDCR